MNHIQVTGPAATRINEQAHLVTFVPMKFTRRSGRKQVIRPDEALKDQFSQQNRPDKTFLTALAKAFHWQRLIDTGMYKSGTAIAKDEGVDLTVVNEMLRLTRLDPLIVEDMLAGNLPERFTLNWFARNPMPVNWQEQRQWIEQLLGDGEDYKSGLTQPASRQRPSSPACAHLQ